MHTASFYQLLEQQFQRFSITEFFSLDDKLSLPIGHQERIFLLLRTFETLVLTIDITKQNQKYSSTSFYLYFTDCVLLYVIYSFFCNSGVDNRL